MIMMDEMSVLLGIGDLGMYAATMSRENFRAQIVLRYTHLDPRFKANPHNIKRFANLLTP
jgi:hypothetical protein